MPPPVEAFNWMGRIKAVEREYRAIRFGTDRLIVSVTNDPSILAGQLRRPDLRAASDRLEGTYVVRVFSEFETALHQFTRAFHIHKLRSAASLINRVRDRGHIPQPETDDVHRVREYRNVLVHERTTPVPQISIREATRFLCTFLSRIQRIW